MLRRNAFALLIVLICIVALQAVTAQAAPLHIVFMIGEDEYKTSETLPEFAKSDLNTRGMETAIVNEDSKDKNAFPGLIDELKKADVLVLSVRRRLLPKVQLDAVRAYLASGKPLVGIRTACHAFAANPKDKESAPASSDSWPEFDPQVLGGNYVGHHKAPAKGAPPEPVQVSAAPSANQSPLLQGVDISQLVGNGTLYRCNPLDVSCEPLLIGKITGQPAEPVAWTHAYGRARAKVFYTSLGHPDDFKEPAFRQLLLNGICWAAAMEKAPDKK